MTIPGCGYGQLLVTPPILQVVTDVAATERVEPNTLRIPSLLLSFILFYF